MLLAIDLGNTNIVFAVYDGENRRGEWRSSTDAQRTADEYGVWLAQLMALDDLGRDSIDAAIIATVVPETLIHWSGGTIPGQFGGQMGYRHDPWFIEASPYHNIQRGAFPEYNFPNLGLPFREEDRVFRAPNLTLPHSLTSARFTRRLDVLRSIERQQKHLDQAVSARSFGRLREGAISLLNDPKVRHAFDVDRSEDAYLASIAGKTASLLATAARIGAIVADHPRDIVEAVTDFGHRYGMAFQVVDDLLDVTATDEQLGKPAGNDLVEGTYTLPVIRALGGPAGAELRDLLGGPIDSATRDRARVLVRSDEAIAATRETAIGYLSAARSAVDGLPTNPAVEAMLATCGLLLGRLDPVG